jgi:hypothetical protein
MGTTKSGLTVVSGTTITSAWGNNMRDSGQTYETSSPTLTQEGAHYVRTDLDTVYRYTGSAHEAFDGYGAWTSYTPYFSGVGASISYGNGSRTGGYRYVGGRTIEFWALFVWGTTTSNTGNWTGMRVELPVAMATHWQYQTPNTIKCSLADATGVQYSGDCLYNLTTEVLLGVLPTAGSHLYRDLATYNSPVAWTTNDSWAIAGVYETAS